MSLHKSNSLTLCTNFVYIYSSFRSFQLFSPVGLLTAYALCTGQPTTPFLRGRTVVSSPVQHSWWINPKCWNALRSSATFCCWKFLVALKRPQRVAFCHWLQIVFVASGCWRKKEFLWISFFKLNKLCLIGSLSISERLSVISHMELMITQTSCVSWGKVSVFHWIK